MKSHCLIGDCRDSMRTLIAQGVKAQMCVTSPPYWGLRDYGHADQLGLEPTPQEYVANMVEVFRLVRDLLADDGVLWLNLGDSYTGSGKGGNPEEGKQATNKGSQTIGTLYGKTGESARQAAVTNVSMRLCAEQGMAAKNLVGIPWRVAFALQADGWWLRQDIIWSKPNPMPESVTDRCTKSHEYLFLLAKSERYYYDAAAIAEPVTPSIIERLSQPGLEQQAGSDRVPGKTNGNMKAVASKRLAEGAINRSGGLLNGGTNASTLGQSAITEHNKRSVWTVATQPYSEAHFATFPPKLIEPCILAGSRPGDIVLDPFFGSGTTGEVCERLGRRWIGCELSPEYGQLAARRTAQLGMVME